MMCAKTARRLVGIARRTSGVPSHRVIALGALLPLLIICPLLYAAGEVVVMRVEEDWEVVLNEPSLDVDAPQLHTVISPFGHLDSLHAQITWNYRELPDFQCGGLQIQAWDAGNCLGKRSVDTSKLSAVAETVSWTQVLQTTGSRVSISVENGQSTTWGSFGGFGLSGQYPLPDLNGYTTSVSEENSYITYGANRVELIRIKEVRRYDSEGNLISRDQTPRIVYERE
jgi:hypothetical protein